MVRAVRTREEAFVFFGEEEIELVQEDGMIRQAGVGLDDLEGRLRVTTAILRSRAAPHEAERPSAVVT